MRAQLTLLALSSTMLAIAGCSGGSESAPSAQRTETSSADRDQADQPRADSATDPAHACSLLTSADFESVGLSQGKAKPDKTISGTECTWDPVLGSGGFLHLQTMGAEQFEKRKQRAIDADAKKSDRAGGEMIAVAGLGDDAFVQKWKPNETITVRAGAMAFHISGNARLKQPQLESLARAVLARL